MLRATLGVAALLLAVPAADAALNDLQFVPPATMGPSTAVKGGQWALLVFSNATAASAALRLPAPSQGTEFLETSVRPRGGPMDPVPTQALPLAEVPQSFPPLDVALRFAARDHASLYVEAERIDWSVEGLESTLRHHEAFSLFPSSLVGPGSFEQRAARYDEFHPAAGVAFQAGSEETLVPRFVLSAANVTVAEWHQAAVTCAQADCPGGGQRDESSPEAGPVAIDRRLLSFQRLTGTGGSLAAEGSSVLALVGGSRVDVEVVGQARLPVANAPPACAECVSPDGRTIRLDGTLSFSGLSVQPDGTMRADVGGDIVGVRLDEAAVDPVLLTGLGVALTATAATAGLLLAAKAILGSLFTRMRPDRALLNATRRGIHSYVEAHPGASLREVAESLGVAVGTVHHHVRVLVGSGRLVEQGHGRARRLFLPSFATEHQRTEAILLREPALKALHDLVRLHPWLTQNDLVDLAARRLASSRSTTQHRLSRLAKGGLLQVRRQGRFRLYGVAEPPSTFRVSLKPQTAGRRSWPAAAG